MLSLNEALDRARSLVTAARKAGADAADAVYGCDASSGVTVRLGALEDVEQSESEHFGLRVFVGQRSASVASSDLTPRTLETLVERAVAMAREAPEDAYAGLAPEQMLMRRRLPSLDIEDDEEPTPAQLRERALAAEDSARSVLGVTNSEGAGAGFSRAQAALATSHGFSGAYAGTSHSLYASVLAGEGAAMQRDFASHSARHLDDLEGPDSIGQRAGARAVSRLNARRVPSGTMPVIFDPRVGNSLIGHLLGAIAGPSVTRKATFLLDSLGQRILPEGLSVIDDPLRERGLRSRPFDGEGLPTGRRRLIDDGVLTGWMLDSASARQLGLDPTGHATRGGGSPGVGASNVHLEGGTASVRDLFADVKRGVFITELIGQGVNGVTGDYSRGASGFLIENGTVSHAVSEITIAGNLKEMFGRIIAANDLTFRRAINVPTLRIDGMTVAGE
ncbi:MULTISPECIES: TldD/PmbA family protein [unclassified Sphingobium]|uniref:TldD/PmbA family protein n=1 Tax=unclassified Sphingobium TaxID=2611147 RepID=UPI0022258FA7|nr:MULTISPECIES: metallopeptidase TldD-related protein [unclassified Sphingobium]MCW2351187.1 PmbA protein [Sphingobium sp. B12D2B]MCW2370407.1 PmbA protein [Sphingobium sp. B11D3D]